MKINFIKCHGSGNDFVLIDGISNYINFSEIEYQDFTQLVSDRTGEIGADGSLFLLPSQKADARMRIFNADGSEPEMCGNGIRCVARMAYELLGKDEFTIETMCSVLVCRKEENIYEGVPAFSVDIVSEDYDKESFPFTNDDTFVDHKLPSLSEKYSYSAINMGNPHVVIKNAEVEENEVKQVGEKANDGHALFPKGVNISFYKAMEKQSIYVQTYERGVGITSSCGTAMSASSIVSCLMKDCVFDQWINVYNKGGMVKCLVTENEDRINVKLLGNATYVYDAEVDFKDDSISDFSINKEYGNESKAYENMTEFCRRV